jgi:nucleotide-binding universal stress UspA family protein
MLPDIKRILYATDLDSHAPHVFRYALKIAQQQQAGITILHAQEPLGAFAQSLVELHIAHDQSEMMHEQAREQVRAKIERRLNELCDTEQCQDSSGRELVAEIAVVEGQPAEKILEKASSINADMIVIGSHRHSAIGEALIGSTTNRVLHRSEIPVLVVRTPGKAHQ